MMKTLIAIPCMDTVPVAFCRSLAGLQLRPEDETEITFSQNSLVYDSRNYIAEKVLSGEYERVLWLDSDMVFNPDLYQRLSAHLDNGIQYISGIYSTRKQDIKPVIYDSLEIGKAHNYLDFPKDSVFEIAASGFGAVMMTRELLETIHIAYGLPFYPVAGFGEDLSFCYRVTLLGRKMYCDSTIKLGHVGTQIFEV